MDAEASSILELTKVLKNIEDQKISGVELIDKDSKVNLFNEFPGLFSEVFSSQLFGGKIPREMKTSTSSEQLKAMSTYLSYRVQKLKTLKEAMSRATNTKDLENIMSMISFSKTMDKDTGQQTYKVDGVSDDLNKSL